MPTTKSSKVEVQKAVAEGNAYLVNEIMANVMVGTTIVIIVGVMLLCLILNEVGVFTADRHLMRLADDPADPEWDNTVLAPVLVNEPLAAYLSTADGLKKRRVRSVVVNSLEDTRRANGKTWYAELSTIITLP